MRGVRWCCKALVPMIFPVLISACGDDDVDFNDARTPEGLTNCSVSQPGHYYIGATFSYTGGTTTGLGREQAVIQALLDINADDVGVHGKKLGLVKCDNASSTSVAADLTRELIGMTPPVAAIIAGDNSGRTVVQAPVAAENGIVLMAGSATAESLTSLADNGYVFRTAPSDVAQGPILADIIFDADHTRTFVINSTNAYGVGLTNVFTSAYSDLGGATATIAHNSSFATGSNTLVQVIAALATFLEDGPAAVLLPNYAVDSAAIINAANEQSLAVSNWFFSDALRDAAFPPGVVDKSIFTDARGTSLGTPVDPITTAFTERYTATWDAAPGSYAVNFYDATMLLALGMQIAEDPENREQVRDALQRTHSGTSITPTDWARTADVSEVDYQGTSGPVDFDDAGDVLANYDIWSFDTTTNAFVRSGCITPPPELATCP